MVKIYQLYGVETAMQMLRPNARWEISNNVITKWEDYREQPTWEEIQVTMDKIKAFEDSIDTVWSPAQIKEYTGQEK